MKSVIKLNKKKPGRKGTKRKEPHCSYCQNHNISVSTRQHQCPYKNAKEHTCDLCALTKDAQTIMRHQQRFWRYMNQKLNLPKIRNGQLCDKCRNHGKIVNKSNHNCRYENEHECKLCGLCNKRRLIMKHLQKARRQGITIRIDEQSGHQVVERTTCAPTHVASPAHVSPEDSDLEINANRSRRPAMPTDNNHARTSFDLDTHIATQSHSNPYDAIQLKTYEEARKFCDDNLNGQPNLPDHEESSAAFDYFAAIKRNSCVVSRPTVSPPSLVCPKVIRPQPGLPQAHKSIYQTEDNTFLGLPPSSFPGPYIKPRSPPLTSRFQSLALGQSSMQNERRLHALESKSLRRQMGRHDDTKEFPYDFTAGQNCLQSIQALHNLAMHERFPYSFHDPYLLRSFMPTYYPNLTNSPNLLNTDASLGNNPLSGLEGMTQMLHLQNGVPLWHTHPLMKKEHMALQFANQAAKFPYSSDSLCGTSTNYTDSKR